MSTWTRRDFLGLLAGAAAGAALPRFVTGQTSGSADRPPNVVLIFTDDQGYQDLGYYGSPEIKTPNLDRMRADGMMFTDFYSANAVCSASRAALLTGCYPPRTGVTGVLWPHSDTGLDPGEVTIADLLKKQGYATACIGKWHLGHKSKFLPTRQGFDYYFGVPYSNDMWIDPQAPLADDFELGAGRSMEQIAQGKRNKNDVPLMRNEKVMEWPVDQSKLTKRYTAEAVNFIKDSKHKPFFVYLPHTMPHIPLFSSEKFKGTSDRGLYGDTIEEIDWSTGEILKTLKELGLDENTLVIFTSDNGPWKLDRGRGGCAHPLRGYKFETYEGGMRVPCLMRWPGQIPAMSTCTELASTIDMLPTLAKLAGAKVPTDRVIDGKNIWPLMADEPGAKTPHKVYQYWRNSDLQAIRVGDWKLRMAGKADSVELFNLRNDISESNNLAGRMPEKVAELETLRQELSRELKANSRPIGKT